MLHRPDVCLLVCCLFGATKGLLKQWIPDTNYENRSNWNTGVVPCGLDRVVFPARGSVYVETAHSVQEMTLPLYGELLLQSAAGFYIGGPEEPGCGSGAEFRFRDSDPLRWFDPALWRAALTAEDLEKGRRVFCVHQERVPCEQDDVVFRAATSFRVDTSSSGGAVAVRSVSVLGETFSRQADLDRYLSSASGRAQFHGGSALAVEPSGCADPAGCVCDNSADRGRICEGVACPPALPCRQPLRPAGHCCDVCGALVSVWFAPGFSLLSYRRRVQRLFLGRPAYGAVRLGMSRVPSAPLLMGLLRGGAPDYIQVVVLDGGAGPVAEALARDLLADVDAHGAELGISEAGFKASSGNGSDPADRQGGLAGALVGAFFGVLVLVLVGAGVVVLRRRGWRPPSIAMPTMPAIPWPRRARDEEALGGPLDAGFENPMFDTPGLMPGVPGIYGAEMSPVSMTTAGVYFVNPAYDDYETDLTV